MFLPDIALVGNFGLSSNANVYTVEAWCLVKSLDNCFFSTKGKQMYVSNSNFSEANFIL